MVVKIDIFASLDIKSVIIGAIIVTIIILFIILRAFNEKLTNLEKKFGDKDFPSLINESLERSNFSSSINYVKEKIAVSFENMNSLKKDISEFINTFKIKDKRGVFGETVLKSLVEDILPREWYFFQKSFENKRPDVVIHIPDEDKLLVIDSKFPLENYENMISSNSNNITDADEKKYKTAFLSDIKTHLKKVKEDYTNGPFLDYAFVFIPSEAIFYFLISDDKAKSIIEEYNKKKVFITSPQSLYFHLQMIHSRIKAKGLYENIEKYNKELESLKESFLKVESIFETLKNHKSNFDKKFSELDNSFNAVHNNFENISKVINKKSE